MHSVLIVPYGIMCSVVNCSGMHWHGLWDTSIIEMQSASKMLLLLKGIMFRIMMFNAPLNNISVLS